MCMLEKRWIQSAVALPREVGPPILAYPLKLPTLSANPFAAVKTAVVLLDPAGDARRPR